MNKDFDTWNRCKKSVHSDRSNQPYLERDIWWCSFGINVGFEHDGTGTEYQRPIVILKGFSDKTCLVAPLTSSLSVHRFRVPIGIVDGRNASAILSQMRVIDTKRLINKIGFVELQMFGELRKTTKDLL